MNKLSQQFKEIALHQEAKERDAHAFLKDYPYVLIHLFNYAWNFYHIFSEFRLGNDFRAGFVIISADSGSWHGYFIELEGPNDRLYTNQGIPSQKLNWAIKQTNDWRDFAWSNRESLAHEFAKLIKPFDYAGQNNLMGKGVPAYVEIEHPKTYIDFDYHVVIGNSQEFNDSDRKAHKHWSTEGVATYDRVYQTMRELESRCDSYEQQVKFLSKAGRGC